MKATGCSELRRRAQREQDAIRLARAGCKQAEIAARLRMPISDVRAAVRHAIEDASFAHRMAVATDEETYV